MRILGIETSCDETALSLLECTGDPETGVAFSILGESLISQAHLHAEFGGVFPNLARREHAKNLVPLLTQTLSQAQLLKSQNNTIARFSEILEPILQKEKSLAEALLPFLESHEKPAIDALAVTVGPGLEPALWVGINFAQALATVWDLPVIPVNHMEGHILIALTNGGTKGTLTVPTLPTIALLVSGGHTELLLMKDFLNYELLGETRDDAAGECFDKCARILGLPYPGGPEIAKLAHIARSELLEESINPLPRPMITDKTLAFSFSGLKTAVKNAWADDQHPWQSIAQKQMAYAREIEDTIIDVLISKTKQAVIEYGAESIVVSGGVSANTELARRMRELASTQGAALYMPTRDLSTDNARMIALAGYMHTSDTCNPLSLVAQGQLALSSSSSK